jgi:hypothetical protein
MGKENTNIPPLPGDANELLAVVKATPDKLGVRSCSCVRQTVDQFVLVSGLPLGPMTRFYLSPLFSSVSYFILLPTASSLTRRRVCSLECLHSMVRSLTTNNHILPCHPRLCSLSVSSYDSQGLRWKYSNPPPHGEPDKQCRVLEENGLGKNYINKI